MDRLDKVIVSQTNYSRKEVKELIKKKKIKVNNTIVLKSDLKINYEIDKITINDIELTIQKYVYLILNKPKGYVSATTDNTQKTILELVPEKYLHRNIFPVGRLDKDTTGLMIITDDGNFAHNILSPKKHVKKVYNVTLDIPVNEKMIKGFAEGIVLNDGKCKTAILKTTGTYTAQVTLTEGRYHQIKRMFGCYGAKVVELHRAGIGNLILPFELKPGECREITEKELEEIMEKT